VRITNSRPLSKMKRYLVDEVIRKAPVFVSGAPKVRAAAYKTMESAAAAAASATVAAAAAKPAGRPFSTFAASALR